jgi:hypothetical protein
VSVSALITRLLRVEMSSRRAGERTSTMKKEVLEPARSAEYTTDSSVSTMPMVTEPSLRPCRLAGPLHW